MATAYATPPEGVSAIRPLEALSLRDLLAAKYAPLEWVIPGILPEGLTLFFAAAKLGKSMVALALMLRMVRHVIGSGTVAGDVLYLSMDDRSKRRLQDRVRSLLGGAELRDGGGNAHFVFRAETLSTGLLTQLDWWLRGHPLTKLIVVDVYAAIKARANGEDVFAGDYKALEELRDFAEQRHISILLLHHTNKRSRASDEDWTLGVNGSMGLLAACDTLWKLERGPAELPGLTLRAKGRDVEEATLYVDLDELDSEWRELAAEESGGDSPSVSESRVLQILETLETLETLSPKRIAERADMNPRTARTCLRRLVAKGLVAQTMYGAYRRSRVSTDEIETLETGPEAPRVSEFQEFQRAPDSNSSVETLATSRDIEAPGGPGHPWGDACMGACVRRVEPGRGESCPSCGHCRWESVAVGGAPLYICRSCHPERKGAARE